MSKCHPQSHSRTPHSALPSPSLSPDEVIRRNCSSHPFVIVVPIEGRGGEGGEGERWDGRADGRTSIVYWRDKFWLSVRVKGRTGAGIAAAPVRSSGIVNCCH